MVGKRETDIRKEKTGADGEHLFHLFVRGKDAHAELWDGTRTGVEQAMEVFNADRVPITTSSWIIVELTGARHMMLNIFNFTLHHSFRMQ